MNKCPFQKAKSFLGIKEGKPDKLIIQDESNEESVKQEVTNILNYLTEKDLTRIDEEHQNISIDDLIDFIQSIKHLEFKEFLERISLYIKDNLSDLQMLKKEINNLHIKMFWEYFKAELDKLGEHDFFGLEEGKLVNIPLENYTGSLWKIQKSSNIEGFEIGKGRIASDYLEKTIFFDKIIGKITFFGKIYSYNKASKSLERIYILLLHLEEFFKEFYKQFLNGNKGNKIIDVYLLLEENIKNDIGFDSSFNYIFPNTNEININKLLEYNISNNIDITLLEIKEFFARQNKYNIARALNGGVFGAELYNSYNLSLSKYNEEKGIVEINIDDITGDIIEEINDVIVKHKLEGKGDGVCPFAQIKSGTQNKNALIEEFEFFDKYMIKVLEEYYKY